VVRCDVGLRCLELLSKSLLHLYLETEGWFLKGVCKLSRCWIRAGLTIIDEEVAGIALCVESLADDGEVGGSAEREV
jgi:hypothetical protein